MDVNALDSGPAAGGASSSILSAAVSEDAHILHSSSADEQTDEPSADVGDTSTPPGPTAEDVEALAADRRAQFEQLAEIILGCTKPVRAAKKWEFLKLDARHRIDMPPPEFVRALEDIYGAEPLTELGLYERVGDELRLPSWLEGDAPLYATIDADNCTLSFSRDNEFLFPMSRTALDYALERNPPDSRQEPVALHIVASPDDVQILQRLGLRAVICEGLQALGRNDVRRLFPEDQPSEPGWRYSLLLMDFDMALLENRPTAAIGQVIERLADAADVYGIDPARRFAWCRPTGRQFHELQLALSFEDSAQICRLFEKWTAAAKSVRINSWRTHFDREVVNYSAACKALNRALWQSTVFTRHANISEALPAYRAAGKGAVIQKFYVAIDSATDPFDQLDLIAAAGFAEAYLDSDPLVRAAEAALAGKNPPSASELQEGLLEQRQRWIVELRRIRRERKAKR